MNMKNKPDALTMEEIEAKGGLKAVREKPMKISDDNIKASETKDSYI